jgi:hypothetical protein
MSVHMPLSSWTPRARLGGRDLGVHEAVERVEELPLDVAARLPGVDVDNVGRGAAGD